METPEYYPAARLFGTGLLVDVLESHELGLSVSGGVGGIVGVALTEGVGAGINAAERADHVREDPSLKHSTALRFLAVGEALEFDVAHFLAGSLFARDGRLPATSSEAAGTRAGSFPSIYVPACSCSRIRARTRGSFLYP